MAGTTDSTLSVDDFCRRHGLSFDAVFTLARHHRAMLPPILEIADHLRIADLGAGDSTFYHKFLSGIAGQSGELMAEGTTAISLEQFSDRYGLTTECLLRLILDDDLPQSSETASGRVAFRPQAVRLWELRKRVRWNEGAYQ